MKHSLSVLAFLALPALAPAADSLTIIVTGGKTDETNVVVRVPLPNGNPPACNVVSLNEGGGMAPVQITGPALTDDPGREAVPGLCAAEAEGR